MNLSVSITGTSDRKSSSTHTEVGGRAFGVGGVVLGDQQHNNEQGNSVSQQQSHSEALSKIKTAAKEGKFSTAHSEVQSLSENLSTNLSEQQSIVQEIAKTKQEMDQLSYSMNYVFQNSTTIDRNINELVLNKIIAQNPEISSKEQAARWAKDHLAEAEKIAFGVAQINNEVPKDLSHNINDGNFLTKKDLQSDFYENVEQLEAIYDKRNQKHSQNIEQAFVDNEKVENLDRISDSIKNKTQEIQKKFDNTSNSAVILTSKEAIKAGQDVLEAVKNLKDNKYN